MNWHRFALYRKSIFKDTKPHCLSDIGAWNKTVDKSRLFRGSVSYSFHGLALAHKTEEFLRVDGVMVCMWPSSPFLPLTSASFRAMSDMTKAWAQIMWLTNSVIWPHTWECFPFVCDGVGRENITSDKSPQRHYLFVLCCILKQLEIAQWPLAPGSQLTELDSTNMWHQQCVILSMWWCRPAIPLVFSDGVGLRAKNGYECI